MNGFSSAAFNIPKHQAKIFSQFHRFVPYTLIRDFFAMGIFNNVAYGLFSISVDLFIDCINIGVLERNIFLYLTEAIRSLVDLLISTFEKLFTGCRIYIFLKET